MASRSARSQPTGRSRGAQELAREALPWLVAAAASTLAMVVVLEVWRADWHAPFLYEQDSIQNLMLIKTTLTHGWPLHESMLGAPFGQELYDFPVVADDVTHLLIIKLIGVFSSNPALVMNVFFLVQFPLTSATALWALRRLGLPVWPSVVCAVIYACAPYHFYRGELHLFLAGYYAVPIGTYLVVRLLMGEPLVVRRPEGGPTRPLGWPALIGLSLFVGCSEIYYAVFTLLLMAVAIVVTLFRPDRRRLLQGAIAATAVIALTAAAAHVPSVIYAAKHGSDKEYAKARTPSDSETFGMRTVRLLLPVNNHRLEPLAKLTDRYNRDSPSDLAEGPPQALGLVMALGFLALIFIALLGVVRAGRPGGVSELLRASSAVAVIATLIGVSGGFSLVLSYYVFDFVRSWNRLSIVIAFVALVPVALGLAWLGTRIQKRSFGKPLWVALLVALTVLAVLDQTGTALVPNYKQLRAQWQNEDAFTKAVEAKLPDKAAIYIAPYSPFPELGYTQARNFLHSNRLRWSFGAMIGRPADWARALLGQPGAVTVPSVTAAGFQGLVIDRGLYEDGGAAADSAVRPLLGPPALLSPDNRFEFYDLRPYAQRLNSAIGPAAVRRLAFLTLHPPRAEFSSTWGPDTPEKAILALGHYRESDSPKGSINILNPSPSPRRARVTANFNTDEGFPANLTVALPDGRVKRLRMGGAGANLDVVMRLRPGANVIRLVSDIPVDQDRKTYIVATDFSLIDEDARLLAAHAAQVAGR